ncbi:MAG: hypothetical protein M1834_001109 [Cirrosporium novae-zelandiae]|nr:MAG: hypothetical protein M1834_001109 [Cirrosporium novae-zelandiae]
MHTKTIATATTVAIIAGGLATAMPTPPNPSNYGIDRNQDLVLREYHCDANTTVHMPPCNVNELDFEDEEKRGLTPAGTGSGEAEEKGGLLPSGEAERAAGPLELQKKDVLVHCLWMCVCQ